MRICACAGAHPVLQVHVDSHLKQRCLRDLGRVLPLRQGPCCGGRVHLVQVCLQPRKLCILEGGWKTVRRARYGTRTAVISVVHLTLDGVNGK
jgi:hypothetical protein